MKTSFDSSVTGGRARITRTVAGCLCSRVSGIGWFIYFSQEINTGYPSSASTLPGTSLDSLSRASFWCPLVKGDPTRSSITCMFIHIQFVFFLFLSLFFVCLFLFCYYEMVVSVVAFSSLARIWGKCSPALFRFLSGDHSRTLIPPFSLGSVNSDSES